MSSKATFNLEWKEVTYRSSKGKSLSIPILDITIEGVLTIFDINTLMKKIVKETEHYNKPYVSITDYSKVNLTMTLQKLILIGMESPLKKIFSVKNPSLCSFVLMTDKQDGESFMRESLKRINSTKLDEDYEYNYVFISDRKEIPAILSKVLTKK